MVDLPEISQNLDDPLPQVDPNSDLVPYRMSRTYPGGQPVVTTGYGPRGRPPIQPPQSFGGGVGMPDLDQVYQAAFSKLPVDEAAKAVEAATRYVAQRAYQRDIQAGADPLRTFAKYAPSMFKQATGLPEVFQAQMQQQKLNAPTIHGAGGGLYRVPARGPAETLVPPKSVPANKLHVLSSGEVLQETGDPQNPVKVVREKPPGSSADKDIDYQIKAQNLLGLKPTELPTDPSYQSRTNLAAEIQKRHPLAANPAQTKQVAQKVTTKEQYDALPSGTIYIGKDDKKYRKP